MMMMMIISYSKGRNFKEQSIIDFEDHRFRTETRWKKLCVLEKSQGSDDPNNVGMQ